MFGLGRNLDKIDWLVLAIGLLVTVKVRVIGIFSVAEFILMAILLVKHDLSFVHNKQVKNMLLLAVLWTIGTFVSNVYNSVESKDFIKGVFFLIALILIIPPIYNLLYEKPERLVLFMLGYGLGQLFARYTTNDTDLALSLSNDVYIYYGVMFAVVGVSYYIYLRGAHNLALLIRYGIAVAGLFYMARNPFLTATVALLLLYVVKREEADDITDSMSVFNQKIPRYFLIAIFAVIAADSIYETLAANGTLGTEAQEKYFTQKMRGRNVLEGGRLETFMGIELIKENPIWGYGSYAKDVNDAFHTRYSTEHNTELVWTGDYDRFLPGHSHIIGAWVQNGLFGGLFWIYILFMCWKVFKSGCIMCEPRMLCLLMFQSCALLWDICFSPFGDRTFTMFIIITLFIIYDRAMEGDYQLDLVHKLNI